MHKSDEVLTALKAARALITKRENWTQHTFARNAQGVHTSSLAEDAVCFCSLGAVKRVAGINKHTPAITWQDPLADEVKRELHASMKGNIAAFNDEHTHEEVLGAFDRAIDAVDRRIKQWQV